MESEGAAFGRVVENARTVFTLKGETRRRRASIGVGIAEGSNTDQGRRERDRGQASSSDFIAGLTHWRRCGRRRVAQRRGIKRK